MKRRNFIQNSSITLFGLCTPFRSSVALVDDTLLHPLLVKGLKWVAKTTLITIGEKVIEHVLFGDENCSPCQEKTNYYIPNTSLRYNVKKPSLPTMPNQEYSAFAYANVSNSSNIQHEKEVFISESHTRKEVAVLLPESVIFAICCVSNMLHKKKYVNINQSKSDSEKLRSLLLPIDNDTASSQRNDSVSFVTEYGVFEFLGRIERNIHNQPISLMGDVNIYKHEGMGNIFEKQSQSGDIKLSFNKLTGSLAFLHSV